MMRVGITGATGVLGRISEQKLRAMGYDVSSFVGDIRDRDTVAQWIRSDEFDAIIHYAATVAVDQVKADPLRAYDVNVCGTVSLLSEIVKAGFSHGSFMRVLVMSIKARIPRFTKMITFHPFRSMA